MTFTVPDSFLGGSGVVPADELLGYRRPQSLAADPLGDDFTGTGLR